MRIYPRLVPLVLLPLLTAAEGSAQVVNRIILRVNDQIATQLDYESRLQERRESLGAADLDPARKQQLAADLSRSTLRGIFDELLLLSRAEQLGIRVSDAEVQQAVTRSRNQAGIDNDEDFVRALAMSGLTLAGYRQQMRRQMLMDHVIGREVRSRVDLDEQTLRRHYRQFQDEFQQPEARRLQEVVLLDTAPVAADERREIAGRIAAQVASGMGLAEAVAPYGREGIATAVVDLGWVGRQDLDPALAEAAWSLAEGELSTPVPARGGLHLIQLVELREGRQVPFEEVRELVQRRVGAERFQDELTAYLGELEDQAYVMARVPPEAEGFRRYGQDSAEQLSETVVGSAGEAASGDAAEDTVDAAAAAAAEASAAPGADTAESLATPTPEPEPVPDATPEPAPEPDAASEPTPEV